MLLGRTSELKQLNHYYSMNENSLVVVYGQEGVGITSFLDEFCKNKEVCYYQAKPASEREQAYLWAKEMISQGVEVDSYPDFSMLFSAMVSPNDGKRILVIEDFQYFIKAGNAFMDACVEFLNNRWNRKQTMIILASSALGFVENSLVTKIGKHAFSINGFLKLKPLSFLDLVCYFDTWNTEQCIMTYGILGGIPKYWNCFDKSLSLEDNILRFILTPGTYLYDEGKRCLLHELREENVYCTILEALACGKQKLNDLYLHTGFSRAKISVYLKNLIQLEIVEKVYSYETGGWENAQKGIYRISKPYMHFYFRYIFSNASKLKKLEPSAFYQAVIEADQNYYYSNYFGKVCTQYLQILNQREMLPFRFERDGEWVGKAGNIDIVAQDNKENTIVGMCNWEKPQFTYEDYEWFLFCVKEAKLRPQYVYLFSIGDFDKKLKDKSEEIPNKLFLIEMKDL